MSFVKVKTVAPYTKVTGQTALELTRRRSSSGLEPLDLNPPVP